jgi:CRP-like cAMP-binding protein
MVVCGPARRPLAHRSPPGMVVPFLQNNLLEGLSHSDFDLLSPHLKSTTLSLGKVLCEPGDEIDRIYFPYSGVVSMLTVLRDGSEVECCTMGNETAFGLTAAHQPSRSCTRDVMQIVGEGASMSARSMQDAVARSKSLAPIFHRHMRVTLGFMAQSAACNARHKVEARLCRWLLTCADYVEDDFLPLTQGFIAAMLGVQRTSVNEAAAGLQDQGIISVVRGKVTVLDVEALRLRSCECYSVTRDLINLSLGAPIRRKLPVSRSSAES